MNAYKGVRRRRGVVVALAVIAVVPLLTASTLASFRLAPSGVSSATAFAATAARTPHCETSLGVNGLQSNNGCPGWVSSFSSRDVMGPAAYGTTAAGGADGGCGWCAEWAVTYDFPNSAAKGWPESRDAALSPNEDLLFVAGFKVADRWRTLLVGAFDTGTGATVWADEHSLGLQDNSPAPHIAVSPDGRTIYVAGVQTVSSDPVTQREIVIAYNTARPEQPGDPDLGERLWVATGAAQHNVFTHGLVVNPDGATILVAGGEKYGGVFDDQDAFTTPTSVVYTSAYEAATGAQRWHSQYASPVPVDGEVPPPGSIGNGIAVSPDGEVAYVTGFVHGFPFQPRPVTLAYGVRGEGAGEVRWVKEFNLPFETGDLAGQGGFTEDGFFGDGIVVSQDGGRVFVTGFSGKDPGVNESRMITIGYDAGTGKQLWWSGFGLPLAGQGALLEESPGQHLPSSIAVSPNDDLVVVAGKRDLNNVASSVVVAYDQQSGSERWSRVGDVGAFFSVASSLDGTMVYAPADFGGTLLAYDSGTGTVVATADLNKVYPDAEHVYSNVVLARRDGTGVIVVGELTPSGRTDVVWAIASYAPPGSSL